MPNKTKEAAERAAANRARRLAEAEAGEEAAAYQHLHSMFSVNQKAPKPKPAPEPEPAPEPQPEPEPPQRDINNEYASALMLSPGDATADIERQSALKKARAGDEHNVVAVPTKTAQDRRVLVVAPDDNSDLVQTAVRDRDNGDARKRLHGQSESGSTALATMTRMPASGSTFDGDDDDNIENMTEEERRQHTNTSEYCKLISLMDTDDATGDGESTFTAQSTADMDAQHQAAPSPFNPNVPQVNQDVAPQACEAPVLPPAPTGPSSAAGRRKTRPPDPIIRVEPPKPKKKAAAKGKGKGKQTAGAIAKARGGPKPILRRPGTKAGLIPNPDAGPSTVGSDAEGEEVEGPPAASVLGKRARPANMGTARADAATIFPPPIDPSLTEVSINPPSTTFSMDAPEPAMSLYEPDSFVTNDTGSAWNSANNMQSYYPIGDSTDWNNDTMMVNMDVSSAPASWFEPIAMRLRQRPDPDNPVPSVEDPDAEMLNAAPHDILRGFNTESDARYGPDHENPTDPAFRPVPKCTYCSESDQSAPCDIRPGRYTLECTNCADRRVEYPLHRCNLIDNEHKLLYRRYKGNDPTVFAREDVCGGCSATAKAITCDMDSVLGIGCSDCLARGVDCFRARTKDKMRRRPAKPTHAQGTWFRRICDMCTANNDDATINGDERPRCSWLDDRGHWVHGCLPCREKNMACTFRGFTVENVELLMRPTSWNPALGLRLSWLKVKSSTNFRKACVRCTQDHAPCYVAMQRPEAACKRCTAFGLSCCDKDGTGFPIFDLSLVGFGTDVEMAFPACKCCIQNKRPCDRQRPCDSCVMNGNGQTCDKPPTSRRLRAGDYRKANLIRTRLNPLHGPLYYLAMGYAASGVRCNKMGRDFAEWIGPAAAVYTTSMTPDKPNPYSMRCLIHPPGVPPHICFGGTLPAVVAGILTRESLVDALKAAWHGLNVPRDTEWKMQHDILDEVRKQFAEWAKLFGNKSDVYLPGLSEDFGQNTVNGSVAVDLTHPWNIMFKAWKAERMRQLVHNGEDNNDDDDERGPAFTWDEFITEDPESLLFSGYQHLPRLPEYFQNVQHQLPEYYSMAARWPLVDRHGMARIGSITEKRKYSWAYFSNHGPWVPFELQADGTRREGCPTKDVLDHLPLRDNEYKLGVECDTRRCSMEGCMKFIVEDQRCASNRHKALVCDDCNARGKRYLVDAGPRAFTTRDLINMRAYLCDACTTTTGDDPAAIAGMRSMGVNTVFGQFINKPTVNCRAKMPEGYRINFRRSAMPGSGCACAAKLFRHRICPDHRSRDASILHSKVREMRTWLIEQFGGIPCPVCAATKHNRVDIQLTSELSGRGAKNRSWVCLACTGWVVNVPSNDKIPAGYENWVSNFAAYNQNDPNEVSLDSENSITRAVQNAEWLDDATLNAMSDQVMSHQFDIDFAAMNEEMFNSAAAVFANDSIVDTSIADTSVIDKSFMDTTFMDETAMTANTSIITSDGDAETRNTSYDEMDIDDSWDK